MSSDIELWHLGMVTGIGRPRGWASSRNWDKVTEDGIQIMTGRVLLCVCVCVCTRPRLHSRVWLFAVPWTAACQAPPSMEFPRQKHWRELPFASPEGSSWPKNWTQVCCVSWIGWWIICQTMFLKVLSSKNCLIWTNNLPVYQHNFLIN